MSLIFHFLLLFVAKGGLFVVLENEFQAKLKKELKQMFPGCIVTKTDPNDKLFPASAGVIEKSPI